MNVKETKKFVSKILDYEIKNNYPHLKYEFVTNIKEYKEAFVDRIIKVYKGEGSLIKNAVRLIDDIKTVNNSRAAYDLEKDAVIINVNNLGGKKKMIRLTEKGVAVRSIYHELQHAKQNQEYNEKKLDYDDYLDMLVIIELFNQKSDDELQYEIEKLYQNNYNKFYIENEAMYKASLKAIEVVKDSDEKELKELEKYKEEAFRRLYNYNFMDTLRVYLKACKLKDFEVRATVLNVFINDGKLKRYDEISFDQIEVLKPKFYQQISDVLTSDEMLKTVNPYEDTEFILDLLRHRLTGLKKKREYNEKKYKETEYYDKNVQDINKEEQRICRYYNYLKAHELIRKVK